MLRPPEACRSAMERARRYRRNRHAGSQSVSRRPWAGGWYYYASTVPGPMVRGGVYLFESPAYSAARKELRETVRALRAARRMEGVLVARLGVQP